MNKNSYFRPQEAEGTEHPRGNDAPETPSLPDNFEDLKLIKQILDERKELEEMAKTVKDQLNSISSSCSQQIAAIKGVAEQQKEVVDKIWKAGADADEMLEEIKQYKDKGLELSGDAQEKFQTYTDDLASKIDETLAAEAAKFDNTMKELQSQHEEAIENLKKKYESEIAVLTKAHEQLNCNQEDIIIPPKAVCSLAAILLLTCLFGGWGYFKYLSLPGNNHDWYILFIACFLEIIAFCFTYYKKSREGEYSSNKKYKGLVFSIGKTIYWLVLSMVLVAYGTWGVIGSDGSPVLYWLLPIAVALSVIWKILVIACNGIFRS